MYYKLFKFTSKIALLFSVLLALFIAIVYLGGFGPIPNSKQLKALKQAEASVVYSADGVLLGKYFQKNRTQVSFNELPKHLVNALVATEDVRFYEHEGIDKIAMTRVLVKTLLLGNKSSGGGSTISQQLAKNLFHRKDFAFLSMPVNKTKEAILANRLESIYSKDEILTLYFNTVPFGEGVYGIESAAQRYFSIPTEKLQLNQAAVLVGILKANTYYNPRRHPDHAIRRRNVVLHQMAKAGYINTKVLKKACKSDLNTKYKNILLENPNGYFLREVKKEAAQILEVADQPYDLEKDGLHIETTLLAELQNATLQSREQQLVKLQKKMDIYWKGLRKKEAVQVLIKKELQQTKDFRKYKRQKMTANEIDKKLSKKQSKRVFNWDTKSQNLSIKDSIEHYLKMVHAAVYGVDVTSGAVQLYVGGNNYEFLPYNLVNSERQAASTFKPFVYTAALENGQKPCQWINNEQKAYEDYDNWTPENYDHSIGGYYSMPGALAKSMNIPTIETYFNTGHKNLQETVNALGLKKELKNGPATALGTTSYSLQNMVHAYIPFATRKTTVSPYFIKSIRDAEGKVLYTHEIPASNSVALDSTNLEIMQLLLKGVVDNGTARKLLTTYKAKDAWAGKTGTSQNYSDSWFIGFNSKFIIGAWVGCKYPSINLAPDIGGGSVAALPIVGNVISKTYSDSEINTKLAAGFPEFSEAVVDACDCDYYREENTLEKIFDLFDKKDAKKKKGNFFSRLFGKKD